MAYNDATKATGKVCIEALITRTTVQNKCARTTGFCHPEEIEESIGMMQCEDVYDGAEEIAAEGINALLIEAASYYGGKVAYSNATLYPIDDATMSARRFNVSWSDPAVACADANSAKCLVLRTPTKAIAR